MKVLHLIDSGGLYGAEIMLLHLAQAQRKLGVQPVICSIGEAQAGDKQIEVAAEKNGIAVRRVRMRRGVNFRGAWQILKFARHERFDVLHSHGYKANILVGLVPRWIRKIPFVSTLHGWTATEKKITALHLYERLDQFSLRQHDAIVAVSDVMLRDSRLSSSVRNRMTVIPNGIPALDTDVPGADAVSAEAAGFRASGFVVGAIGRLSREKAHCDLLEAVAVLKSQGRDVRAVIIGEGPERQRLQEVADRLGIGERLSLLGYRDRAEEYLRFFDLFVLTSITEGLPITLLEAMRAKVPIVATSVGGVPGVFCGTNGAMLVSPGNSAELAMAISAIMEDAAGARELAENSHGLFVEKFTSDKMADGYMAVYRQVMRTVS